VPPLELSTGSEERPEQNWLYGALTKWCECHLSLQSLQRGPMTKSWDPWTHGRTQQITCKTKIQDMAGGVWLSRTGLNTRGRPGDHRL
jgi:hypothetical protein